MTTVEVMREPRLQITCGDNKNLIISLIHDGQAYGQNRSEINDSGRVIIEFYDPDYIDSPGLGKLLTNCYLNEFVVQASPGQGFASEDGLVNLSAEEAGQVYRWAEGHVMPDDLSDIEQYNARPRMRV